MAVNYALTSADAWGTPAAIDYGLTRTDPSALQSVFSSTRTVLTGVSDLAKDFIAAKRDIAIANSQMSAAVTPANSPTPPKSFSQTPMNGIEYAILAAIAGIAIFALRKAG